MKNLTLTGLAVMSLLAQGAAQARPDPQQPMVAHVLKQTGTGYAFQTRTLDSADGQRHYRLYIGRPDHDAPATGYPVVYLLDGNAAVGALDRALLQQVDSGEAPPVIVAIGSTSPLRIDRTARTFDYTPKLRTGPQLDGSNGLPSGGADDFLDLLELHIKPLVEQALPVDRQRQMLWGHSYGGLLVLHALCTRPDSFQTYVAASPSLWWGDAAVKAEVTRLPAHLEQRSARLLLMRGDAESGGPGAQAPPQNEPGAAMDRLLSQLQGVPGLHTRYRIFPGLGHGPMLSASLTYALLHGFEEDIAPTSP